MKTQNNARKNNSIMAVIVFFAVLMFAAGPFIGMDAAIPGVSDHSGMSPGDSVSAYVSFDIISPLNLSFKAAAQCGISQPEHSLKHSLQCLQLSLVMVMAFAVLRTRGLSYHFSKAVIRTSPISISIGGHAPPFFRA